ncbi:helix-turn-helix domain-containing protein [Microbulbifer sp. ZKSA002]|uniref:helix-turn-helix domain-containing protein n=1 Tax=Microbulbifer sp. ZKSA002 TaxID=3243388 RepID=UPI00403A5F0B
MSKSLLEVMQNTAEWMHEDDMLDKAEFEEITKLCRPDMDKLPIPKIEKFSAQDVKAIREHNGVSQPVFARVLNTSLSLVQQWERGARTPKGAAAMLLHLVKQKGISCLLDKTA